MSTVRKGIRHRVRTRRASTAALTLLMAGVLGTAGAGASSAGTSTPAQQKKQIASSVLGSDYKITLTALQSPEDQYAATVELQVYKQSGGAWKETDLVTVGDVNGWFWFPVTGSGAICEFSTASTEPAPLAVSLLVTPSIGCSDPVNYLVKEGRVYAA
ncbi:hypothetical protein ACIPC1_17215 [Streptomyces sp. NPDC087263]|uniref:hypothetical protein n=1 Tax=Streptomyces sp. NPDC087263 TaxID=3365773 RepID=UPI00380775E3